MAYMIFDLDGTVIDSNHRKATRPDGSLDLEHWFENNTPDKIMKDGLLPLAKAMRAMYAIGHKVIVCTARSIQAADILYLNLQGLRYHELLHREQGCTKGDGVLKIELLSAYFKSEGFDCITQTKAIMFDDNLEVIEAVKSIGVRCYDATKLNQKLAA